MKSKSKKRILLFVILAITVLASGFFLFHKKIAPTKVALISFPEYRYGQIIKANENKWIKITPMEISEMKHLSSFDFILVFSFGVQITPEQEQQLIDAGKKGVSVYRRRRAGEMNNLASGHLDAVSAYSNNQCTQNYKRLLNYIRREIDGKTIFSNDIVPARIISANSLFYKDEDAIFDDLESFNTYCRENNLHKKDVKRIAIFAGIPRPFDVGRDQYNKMIEAFEQLGYNVYPISADDKRKEFLEEIAPNAVVYFPLGRFAGSANTVLADYLKKLNVPVFCPLSLYTLHDEWLKENGRVDIVMSGQRIVLPQLDGGIVHYAVGAQYRDENGYIVFDAEPERLDKFCTLVDNFVQLQEEQNKDKKVAILYYKGPGKNAMGGSGIEGIPSLYNALLKLKAEGYSLTGLPDSCEDFRSLLTTQGKVFGAYAKGAFNDFVKSGYPELIPVNEYIAWSKEILVPEMWQSVIDKYGYPEDGFMVRRTDTADYMAVSRIRLGNVVIMPIPLPGYGDNEFELIHGTEMPPPHSYLASYFWLQKGFKADAVMHFGTHGSLEFLHGKGVALSAYDWPDPLIGTTPHFYPYNIAVVGEGIIAKRRSYATLLSHLTPPFMESDALKKSELHAKISKFEQNEGALKQQYGLSIKKLVVEEGLHVDLGLNDDLSNPLTEKEVHDIEHYLEEIAREKVTGNLYVIGRPYNKEELEQTTRLMRINALSYNMARIDELKGKISHADIEDNVFFNKHYVDKGNTALLSILKGGNAEAEFSKLVSQSDLERAENWENQSKDLQNDSLEQHETAFADAVFNVKRELLTLIETKDQLAESPNAELNAMINALNGGYIPPSPGGDPVATPEAVPTGRNMYSVNEIATPTKEAWEVGKRLGHSMLQNYLEKYGEYPQKVSFTLWIGSFIESEGITIAEILYMLGAEPVWGKTGVVTDVRLIPAKELNRPRIDVVIQTSGQFRDVAASRLFLIQKAVEMAALDKNAEQNFIAKGVRDAEQKLIEKGLSPKDARKLSTARIFGGVNNSYGSGIMDMVESSGSWDSTSAVAKTYIHNMGAVYGKEKNWAQFREGVFEAALLNTDAMVQPRQSNTWGPLSLDHVYEFMGGLNIAVKEITGKEVESYFNDYRNASYAKVQTLQQALWAEARSTMLNPKYIKEKMKGEASAAEDFAEVFRNSFGWNVMKPEAIDDQLWNKYYDVYVENKLNTGVDRFFKDKNPYAYQEMTAIMLETIRKELWNASPEQLKTLAELHTRLVNDFDAGCSGFVCDNAKLQHFIENQIENSEQKEKYAGQISKVREVSTNTNNESVVLRKEKQENVFTNLKINSRWILIGFVFVLVLLIVFIKRRRR